MALRKQIEQALRLYLERGELTNSATSARRCLEESEFEWSNAVQFEAGYVMGILFPDDEGLKP